MPFLPPESIRGISPPPPSTCWQETLWILNFSLGVLNRDYKLRSREFLSSVSCGKVAAGASLDGRSLFVHHGIPA